MIGLGSDKKKYVEKERLFQIECILCLQCSFNNHKRFFYAKSDFKTTSLPLLHPGFKIFRMMPSTLKTQLLPFSLAKYKFVPDTLGWHLDPNVKAQPKFCLGAKRSGPLTKPLVQREKILR